jgi:energy-converting hydrogenase B subunit G
MNIYDIILKKIKDVRMETGDDRPVSNMAASSMLTAEITLISSLLIAVVMFRLLNKTLMIALVVAIFVLVFVAMPIMPRLKREQNDSIASMSFYVIIALAIIVVLFYWGNLNV